MLRPCGPHRGAIVDFFLPLPAIVGTQRGCGGGTTKVMIANVLAFLFGLGATEFPSLLRM